MENERIKEILSNNHLLAWVKANGSEGLQEDTAKVTKALNVEVSENSLGIMEQSQVCMFVSQSKFAGIPHTTLSGEVLLNVLRLIKGKSNSIRICISQEANRPVIVEDGEGNTIVVAPRSSDTYTNAPKPKEEKKKEKPKEEDEDIDEECD